jgi:membrane-associated PAP2 superfamily phosphatase
MKWRVAGWDRTLWPAVGLLAAALALFELTGLDLAVQDRFYDFAAHRWAVDADNPLGKLLFYDGPKIAIIFPVAIALLVFALGPVRWREKFRFARRDLWVAFLALGLTAALAGAGKKYTNTFCPSEIRRYGGDVPYVQVCSPYPENDTPARKGHCFPAGHASGGFGLLGLMWIFRSRRGKWAGAAAALGLGWWMGGYQMLKGAHYLSHTVVTMLLAWIIVFALRRIIRPEPDA